jgi:magnesium transporter
MNLPPTEEKLQEALRAVEGLLDRHRVLETLTHRQEGPKRDLLETIVHRQNLAELAARLRSIHPADLAYVLQSLPAAERALTWEQLDARRAGAALLELPRRVRETVLRATPRERARELLRTLDADDLAYVADSLEPALRDELYASLDADARSWVDAAVAHPAGSVGQLMTPDAGTVRDTWTLGATLGELRRRGALPERTETLYVVDARNVLRGALALRDLLLRGPEEPVAAVMTGDVVSFPPDERAADAAKAFERYDLLAAPVVDERGKVVGRLTVDAVLDFLRAESEMESLKRAGLQGDEDLPAPVWHSARNRWLWLAVNLVTAFAASRVIGAFEDTIAKLVALAALMPVVASVGGNTGNQTIALMIRGLALGHLTGANVRRFAWKELSISVLNGVVWGLVTGLLAFALYRSLALGVVMASAILLNLLVAAVVGVSVPLLLRRLGRDPAQGASVLLTFTTDSTGFFIFLGLARVFLVDP